MTFQNNTEIKSAGSMIDGLIGVLVKRAKENSKEYGGLAERKSKQLKEELK